MYVGPHGCAVGTAGLAMSASVPRIFCLEGAWEKRLDDRTSVIPTLEMLERLRLAFTR